MVSKSDKLPDELLLLIFEKILQRSQTLHAYGILRNCMVVCKRWAAIAGEVLLYCAEVATSDAAHLLGKRLQQVTEAAPGKSFIRTLVYAARKESAYAPLDQILALDPGVRHLVFCAGFGEIPTVCAPRNLSSLQSLTDVSLLSTLHPKYPPQFLHALLPLLPVSVNFLNFPQDTPSVSWPEDVQPAFSLYGLTTPSYSLEVTDWVLQRSRDSLRCLTVSTSPDLAIIAENHPNLRSLKIFDTWHLPSCNFGALKHLERLEIRGLVCDQGSREWSLPDSLQYIRVWSQGMVRKLNDLLEDCQRLPNLDVVVWDWSFADASEEATGLRLMETLKELSIGRGIELRTYQRGIDASVVSWKYRYDIIGPLTTLLSPGHGHRIRDHPPAIPLRLPTAHLETTDNSSCACPSNTSTLVAVPESSHFPRGRLRFTWS